jgi:hypothetical protein
MLDRLIEFLERFEEKISVTILEDNKYVIENGIFEKQTFLRELAKQDFCFCGGNDREFYISINDNEYTIQVSNVQISEELYCF